MKTKKSKGIDELAEEVFKNVGGFEKFKNELVEGKIKEIRLKNRNEVIFYPKGSQPNFPNGDISGFLMNDGSIWSNSLDHLQLKMIFKNVNEAKRKGWKIEECD